MISDIIESIREFVSDLTILGESEEFPVKYPSHSPLAGSKAGRFMLKRAANNQVDFVWHDAPRPTPFEALAELTVNHQFDHVEHMVASLRVMDAPNCEVFVNGTATMSAQISTLIDRSHPEKGLVCMDVFRHPRWARWFRALLNKEERDLTHSQLVDLLLDNAEDLDDEMVARSYSRFRSAKSVIYDADLGGQGHEGVKVTWKGSTGKNAETEDLALPSEFTAQLPAYVGAWQGGDEPKHLARFTIRVMPPNGKDDSPPMFRVRWTNLSDYELMAREALFAAVKDAFGDLPDGVYLGSPNVVRYVLPEPTTDED